MNFINSKIYNDNFVFAYTFCKRCRNKGKTFQSKYNIFKENFIMRLKKYKLLIKIQ